MTWPRIYIRLIMAIGQFEFVPYCNIIMQKKFIMKGPEIETINMFIPVKEAFIRDFLSVIVSR
jgi:hypothetical protein